VGRGRPSFLWPACSKATQTTKSDRLRHIGHAVYTLGAEILRYPATEILFVSSNYWDRAGVKALVTKFTGVTNFTAA
jgi:hypothetical protein